MSENKYNFFYLSVWKYEKKALIFVSTNNKTTTMYTLLSASSTNTVIKTTFSSLQDAKAMQQQIIALKREAGMPYTVKIVNALGKEI